MGVLLFYDKEPPEPQGSGTFFYLVLIVVVLFLAMMLGGCKTKQACWNGHIEHTVQETAPGGCDTTVCKTGGCRDGSNLRGAGNKE